MAAPPEVVEPPRDPDPLPDEAEERQHPRREQTLQYQATKFGSQVRYTVWAGPILCGILPENPLRRFCIRYGSPTDAR
jgi:hypothetical protein